MNVRDGLVQIRERLYERDARTETLELVDTMIKRASEPGADRAQASLPQIVGLLSRTPVANANIRVYDELMELQDELTAAASQRAVEAAEEASKPLPKSRKYYRQRREREQN
ncbi:MAG: hypothetical protein R3A46_18915 [Thermomicrobiales bacterium]